MTFLAEKQILEPLNPLITEAFLMFFMGRVFPCCVQLVTIRFHVGFKIGPHLMSKQCQYEAEFRVRFGIDICLIFYRFGINLGLILEPTWAKFWSFIALQLRNLMCLVDFF